LSVPIKSQPGISAFRLHPEAAVCILCTSIGKGAWRMRRKLIGIAGAVVVLAGLVIPAGAAQGEGTISVTLDYGDGQVHESALSLQQVGSRVDGGYRLYENYGGGVIRTEDIESAELAQWLAETAQGIQIPRILDADGNASYTGLGEGLYLLVQSETAEGDIPIAPFLIPMPCYGQWEVTAYPKVQQILTESPKTGQHPAPLIGAMGMVLSGLGLVMCADKFRRK